MIQNEPVRVASLRLPVSEGALRFLRRHDPIVAAAPLVRLALNAVALGLAGMAVAAAMLWRRAERRGSAPPAPDAPAAVAPHDGAADTPAPSRWRRFRLRRNGAG